MCVKEFGKRKNRRILHIRAYWFNAGILSFYIAAERMNYAIMREKKIGFFCSSRIRGTSIKWPVSCYMNTKVDFSVVFPIYFCSIVTRRHFSPNGNPIFFLLLLLLRILFYSLHERVYKYIYTVLYILICLGCDTWRAHLRITFYSWKFRNLLL